MQAWLVAHVREYFERQQIAVEIDLAKPGPHIVADIIRAAGAKAGAVAQHLVGAKLVRTLPGVRNRQLFLHYGRPSTRQSGRLLRGEHHLPCDNSSDASR